MTTEFLKKYPIFYRDILIHIENEVNIHWSDFENAKKLKDMGFDSLDEIELICKVESTCGIKIDDNDLEKCYGDIEKLSALILKALAKKENNVQP